MKITFFSNFLNHHQLPFCKEMYECIDYISARNVEVRKMIKLWSDVHYEKEDFIDERYRS